MDEKEIIPYGFRRLKYAKNKDLDYNTHKFCLVGEGHKNNDDFTHINHCQNCCDFALGPASEAMNEGKETFQNFKLDLFTHMLEAHPELMIK